MRLAQFWRRYLRPSRTIRPTREGWWFLLATLALGLAAFNTGNNLLYLLVSTLLGLIVVSGILSEQSMRGLRLTRVAPKDIFAGQPALLGLVVTNTKRWRATYSVALKSSRAALEGLVSYLPKLEPGQEVFVTVEERFPRRGRQRLPAVRIVTRFPFGFFQKANRPLPGEEVVVYPAVRRLTPEDLSGLGGARSMAEQRAGRGIEFRNLREYRWGDDPRLIHWKSSAKGESLIVRELEAEAGLAVRLLLEPGQGSPEPEALEAQISLAASLAVHLIDRDAQVELVGPGVHVPLGQGPVHLRRILGALALFDLDHTEPALPAGSEALTDRGASLRVIRIPLGRSAAR